MHLPPERHCGPSRTSAAVRKPVAPRRLVESRCARRWRVLRAAARARVTSSAGAVLVSPSVETGSSDRTLPDPESSIVTTVGNASLTATATASCRLASVRSGRPANRTCGKRRGPRWSRIGSACASPNTRASTATAGAKSGKATRRISSGFRWPARAPHLVAWAHGSPERRGPEA